MSYTESAWQLGADAFKRGDAQFDNPWEHQFDGRAYNQITMHYYAWNNGWTWARHLASAPSAPQEKT